MEVSETAACGISQREFAIAFDSDELAEMYRVLRYTLSGAGFIDENFLEELKSQLVYIIGPTVEDEPESDLEPEMEWEDTGIEFTLSFKEEDSGLLYRLLNATESPGGGKDLELNRTLLAQMTDMAPTILDNLPVINR